MSNKGTRQDLKVNELVMTSLLVKEECANWGANLCMSHVPKYQHGPQYIIHGKPRRHEKLYKHVNTTLDNFSLSYL